MLPWRLVLFIVSKMECGIEVEICKYYNYVCFI